MQSVNRLTVVISANGFGHIRRQILVARELLNRFKNFQVQFAVTDKQFQRFKLEIDALGQMAEAFPGVMEESVRWRLDPKDYSDANLNGWETEWINHPKLKGSDFVLSDNLVAALDYRPDTVLSGSFLWHEVVEIYSDLNEACKKFVAREIDLLQIHRPKMICNASIVTNRVGNLTDPVPVSWMVDNRGSVKSTSNDLKELVLVHGGGTQALNFQIREIVSCLRDAKFEVTTDLEDDEHRFDYDEKSWAKVGVAICRPGAGTATECVKWSIPMLVLRDESNSETEFIAEKLCELGLAHKIDSPVETSQLFKLVGEVLSVESREAFLSPFRSCVKNGIVESVDFLEKHWNLS